MATLRDRLNALLRYRVGKYDSQTLANDLGIYGTTVSGTNINEDRKSTRLNSSHLVTSYAVFCLKKKTKKTKTKIPDAIH